MGRLCYHSCQISNYCSLGVRVRLGLGLCGNQHWRVCKKTISSGHNHNNIFNKQKKCRIPLNLSLHFALGCYLRSFTLVVISFIIDLLWILSIVSFIIRAFSTQHQRWKFSFGLDCKKVWLIVINRRADFQVGIVISSPQTTTTTTYDWSYMSLGCFVPKLSSVLMAWNHHFLSCFFPLITIHTVTVANYPHLPKISIGINGNSGGCQPNIHTGLVLTLFEFHYPQQYF